MRLSNDARTRIDRRSAAAQILLKERLIALWNSTVRGAPRPGDRQWQERLESVVAEYAVTLFDSVASESLQAGHMSAGVYCRFLRSELVDSVFRQAVETAFWPSLLEALNASKPQITEAEWRSIRSNFSGVLAALQRQATDWEVKAGEYQRFRQPDRGARQRPAAGQVGRSRKNSQGRQRVSGLPDTEETARRRRLVDAIRSRWEAAGLEHSMAAVADGAEVHISDLYKWISCRLNDRSVKAQRIQQLLKDTGPPGAKSRQGK